MTRLKISRGFTCTIFFWFWCIWENKFDFGAFWILNSLFGASEKSRQFFFWDENFAPNNGDLKTRLLHHPERWTGCCYQFPTRKRSFCICWRVWSQTLYSSSNLSHCTCDLKNFFNFPSWTSSSVCTLSTLRFLNSDITSWTAVTFASYSIFVHFLGVLKSYSSTLHCHCSWTGALWETFTFSRVPCGGRK